VPELCDHQAMEPFLAGFADELVKVAAKEKSRLRKLVTLGAGAGAAYGVYRYGRKVRLAKDPMLRSMQRKAKGRLTHVEELETGIKPAAGVRKKVKEAVRGIDELIEETPKQWRSRWEGYQRGEPIKKVRKVEGAVHSMGEPIAHRAYPSDLPLAKRFKQILRVALQARLNKKFPQGYVIKPVVGEASGGVPTHQTRFADLLAGKGAPQHKKWMSDMLDDPTDYMVQEYIPIARERVLLSKPPFAAGRAGRKVRLGKEVPAEYRVHVFGGKVIPGASSHRWAIGQEIHRRGKFRELDKFVQENIDKLPASRVHMPMALDVARTADGKWRIIEANIGGQSGFLTPDTTRTLSMAPHAVYRGITGRSSKPAATVKGLLAGGAATAAASQTLNQHRSPALGES
jgi:hypothetical protein